MWSKNNWKNWDTFLFPFWYIQDLSEWWSPSLYCPPSHMTFMCISTYMVYKTGYGTMFFCNLCICANLLKGKNYYSGHSGVRLYFYKWCILKFQMTAWQDFVPHKAILTPGSPGKVYSKIILISVRFTYRKFEKKAYRVFLDIWMFMWKENLSLPYSCLVIRKPILVFFSIQKTWGKKSCVRVSAHLLYYSICTTFIQPHCEYLFHPLLFTL